MAPTALGIAEIVAEARSFEIPHVVHRDDAISDLPEPKPFNLVHIITGIRRAAKRSMRFNGFVALSIAVSMPSVSSISILLMTVFDRRRTRS